MTGALENGCYGDKPQSADHALLIGMVAGFAMREGWPVQVLDDPDGDHTDAFLIERPSGTYRVTIKPADARE